MKQTYQCHKRRKPTNNPVYYNFKNTPRIGPALEPASQAIAMVNEIQPEQLSTSDYYSYTCSKHRACSRDISA